MCAPLVCQDPYHIFHKTVCVLEEGIMFIYFSNDHNFTINTMFIEPDINLIHCYSNLLKVYTQAYFSSGSRDILDNPACTVFWDLVKRGVTIIEPEQNHGNWLFWW